MEMTLFRGRTLATQSDSRELSAEMEEELLVRRAATGDEKAYGRLVQAYQARLFNFVRSMVNNQELAEDITQEAFVKAFFNLSKLKEPARFKSWLFRIANNNTLDYLRKKRLPQQDVDDQVRESYVDGHSPEQGTLESVRSKHIRTALEQLKPDQRNILVMCDLQGLSYQEIAEVLNIPFGTVQSRIFYARKKLREFLDPSIVFGGEA
ncbi:sigma-70 family RNA polymerase sigma factor [bacterium]|nr:sigma-70 family RNA polymerase sigma factor [bacterium]